MAHNDTMCVPLQDFLNGTVYRTCMLIFEAAMNPFIKSKMKEHFPIVDPNDEYAVFQRDWPDKLYAYENEMRVILENLENAQQLQEKVENDLAEERDPKSRRTLAQTKAKAKSIVGKLSKELAALEKKKGKEQAGPQERWVRECRKAFPNDKMRKFVTADAQLDLYSIAAIVRYHLKNVFASGLQNEDVFEVKGLLQKLIIASEMRTRRAHTAPPSEVEVIDALGVMKATLVQCGLKSAVQEFLEPISKAQLLVDKATEATDDDSKRGARSDSQLLTVTEWETLVLYQAMNKLETRLEHHKNRVRQAGKDLSEVTKARHWLYHHTSVDLDVAKCLKTMEEVLQSLHGIGREADLSLNREAALGRPFPDILQAGLKAKCDNMVCVEVSLQLSRRGMSVPLPRDPLFVGRADMQRRLCEAILLPPSEGPVLLQGLAGVGKDTLLSETVRLPQIAKCPEITLAMWLQGSTNITFCQQLVDKFRIHRRKVGRSATNQAEALSAIRQWLLSHEGWLMAIEDVTVECEGLWKYVPFGHGRVVMTSQERLDKQENFLRGVASPRLLTLEPLRTEHSILLLRKMRLFHRFKSTDASDGADAKDSLWTEEDWQAACEATGGTVRYQAAVANENNEGTKQRHYKMRILLREHDLQAACEATGGTVQYQVKVVDENAKGTKQRHSEMRSLLRENVELSTPGLDDFIEEELGNLPLSVKLIGNLLRAEGLSVRELMAEFGSTKKSNSYAIKDCDNVRDDESRGNDLELADAEVRAHNPSDDRHYFGLVLSVSITIRRMLRKYESNMDLHQTICELLVCMSTLDRSQTPCAMFTQDLRPDAKEEKKKNLKLFQSGEGGRFEELRECLRVFGLLTGGDDVLVGSMHQLVLRALREQVLKPLLAPDIAVSSNTSSAISGPISIDKEPLKLMTLFNRRDDASWVTSVMTQLFNRIIFKYKFSESEFGPKLRERLQIWSPSVQSIVDVFAEQWCPNEYCENVFILCDQLRTVLLHLVGDARAALPHAEKALEWARSRLPSHIFATGASMHGLGSTYSYLGRHADALEMREQTLEFRQRVLPADHPDIAASMGNLAITYSKLGRHADALEMEKQTLEFRQRILLSNIPDIAKAMNNLGNTYSDLGRHEDALKMRKPALEFRQRVLPADHPNIATSMNNLAITYSYLGRHADALKMREQTLEFLQRVLPADHPDIAASMGNLGSTYSNLGRHADALEMREQTLEFRQRVLPSDHPDIATTMNNLGNTYSDLGRHADALKMREQTLEFRQRVLPADHPDIAASMNNLANTYFFLGRHVDALEMRKQTLEFRQRVLPADHSDIAESMGNLGSTYSHLGRHADALEMKKQTLEFYQRVLPADHPHIATIMSNLAITYSYLGRYADALEMREQTLKLRQRVLPADHPDIAASMGNLASTYSDLGRHADALKIREQTLEFCQRVLPADHPDIAASMNNLASTYFDLGRHADALEMMEQKLKFLQRVLPANHPDIATNMGILTTLREVCSQRS